VDQSFLSGYKQVREMIKYLNIMLIKFPKHEKFLLAGKIRELGYTIFESVIALDKKIHKKTTLTEMNLAHELLRQLVNLAYELKYIDSQKHRVAQKHIDTVGKYIGYWIRTYASQ